MSLNEWSERFGHMVNWDHNGNIYVILDRACEKAKSVLLYSLRDFKVSSVCGVVYYLNPIKWKNEKVKILVIPTNDEIEIANQSYNLLSNM
mgnify:CR=1 FL=1